MNTPEPGFYYHYKHDLNGTVDNFAYEVIATGTHTESLETLVVYRSLYTTETQGGSHYWIRPLEMFMGTIEKNGKTFPRFIQITDAHTISELTAIRDRMYSKDK
ncbi:MAG: DUF1653 domain-containing protein [Patescibacteria group bacterium]